MELKNKRCIITGGAGFIGSHLVNKLLELNNEVIVIDDLSTGKKSNLVEHKNLVFINNSILDTELLNEIIKEGDYIFHEAAIPSVPKSIKDPIATQKSGTDATLNLLYHAKEKKAKRVILASSSSVYGDSISLPKKEDMQKNPLSPYALTKSANEDYARIFYNLYGLETICLRYFNVFGQRQDPNSEYSAVIPKFIFSIIRGENPIIYGDGKQSRDFTYINNVISANLLSAVADKKALGKTMNVASGIQVNLLELLKQINEIFGTNVKPIFKESRKGDIKDSFADITLAKDLINYNVLISFEKGLLKTVKWFLENKEKYN